MGVMSLRQLKSVLSVAFSSRALGLCLALTMASATCVLVSAQEAADDAPAPADPDFSTSEAPPPGPAVVELLKLNEEWSKLRFELRTVQGQFVRAAGDKRQELETRLDDLVLKSEDLLARIGAAADKAIVEAPENEEVQRLIGVFASIALRDDRFEEALQRCKLMIDANFPNPQVYAAAGRAAFELGNVDEAVRLWTIAEEKEALDAESKKFLQDADSWRTRFTGAQAQRRRDLANKQLPVVRFETTRGEFLVLLLEDEAPNLVANFISLVHSGFFDGLPFYRVASGLGAFAGCPNGDGTGGPGYEIDLRSDSRTNRPHLRGSLSMVSTDRDTAGSQFFIATRPSWAARMDDDAQVFGFVGKGMEVVNALRRYDKRTAEVLAQPDKILHAEMVRSPRQLADLYKPVRVEVRIGQLARDADRLMKQEEFAEAADLLAEAVRLKPDNGNVLYAYSQALQRLDRLDEAMNLQRKAAKLAPENGAIHFDLAVNLLRVKKYEEAKVHFEKALELVPGLDAARRQLEVVNAAIEKQKQLDAQTNTIK